MNGNSGAGLLMVSAHGCRRHGRRRRRRRRRRHRRRKPQLSRSAHCSDHLAHVLGQILFFFAALTVLFMDGPSGPSNTIKVYGQAAKADSGGKSGGGDAGDEAGGSGDAGEKEAPATSKVAKKKKGAPAGSKAVKEASAASKRTAATVVQAGPSVVKLKDLVDTIKEEMGIDIAKMNDAVDEAVKVSLRLPAIACDCLRLPAIACGCGTPPCLRCLQRCVSLLRVGSQHRPAEPPLTLFTLSTLFTLFTLSTLFTLFTPSVCYCACCCALWFSPFMRLTQNLGLECDELKLKEKANKVAKELGLDVRASASGEG